MKKTITQWSMVVALTVGSLLNAQTTGVEDDKGRIGVNTNTPRATLDIQTSAENLTESATTNEGIIPPKISKTRLAQIANDKLVEGTIVYIDNVRYTATPANVKVEKVTEKGYYEYNGTEWQPLSTNIYNQDGTLTTDRTVNITDAYRYGSHGKYGKYLIFTGGRIGRNIREPRSAVDLGNYDVIKNWAGITSVKINNGLIPPQMTKQYVHTMSKGLRNKIEDGTIVYLTDLTAPEKAVCGPDPGASIPVWKCKFVPADPNPQMSEMTEKGLYIFNQYADKWKSLKGGKYRGMHGVRVVGDVIVGDYEGEDGIHVQGKRIGLSGATISKIDKIDDLDEGRLVPFEQIKDSPNRTKITGTSGYFWKDNEEDEWRYEGLVSSFGDRNDTKFVDAENLSAHSQVWNSNSAGWWSYIGGSTYTSAPTITKLKMLMRDKKRGIVVQKCGNDWLREYDWDDTVSIAPWYVPPSFVGGGIDANYSYCAHAYTPSTTGVRSYGLVRVADQLWRYDE